MGHVGRGLSRFTGCGLDYLKERTQVVVMSQSTFRKPHRLLTNRNFYKADAGSIGNIYTVLAVLVSLKSESLLPM